MAKQTIQVDTLTLKRATTETFRRLRELEVKIQKRVLRKGANAGGRVFLKALKKETPQGNKFLSRSMDVRVKTFKDGNVAAVVGQNLKKRADSIRPTKAQARRGLKGGGISGRGKVVPDHLVAGFVDRHRINRKTARALRWITRGGNERFAPAVINRGHSGNNFHEKTYRDNWRKADNVTFEKIQVETDAEVAKIAKPMPT